MKTQTMSVILLVVAGAAALFGVYAFSVSTDTNSAIHEIESRLGLLIAAVAFAGSATVTMLGRVHEAVNRGTQVVLNEAKMSELRYAGTRSAK